MIDGETVCNHGRFQWGGARRFWKVLQGLNGFVLVHCGCGEVSAVSGKNEEATRDTEF